MQKRQYRQLCPVAYALDALGERWTLLIIRDLLYGERRFSDLLRGLPGIGTNLLSKRLQNMEATGLIARRTLPPPSSSTVYQLTQRGGALAPVVGALAHWGTALLAERSEEDYLGIMPMLGSLNLLFRAEAQVAEPITCQFRTDDDAFYAVLDKNGLQASQGETESPEVIAHLQTKNLLSMLGHPEKIADSGEVGAIQLQKGKVSRFRSFLAAFNPVEKMSSG